MKKLIQIKNYEKLNETKEFIAQYFSQKNKGIENGIYLSMYLSVDNDTPYSTRGVRFNKMLRDAELNLKSQVNAKVASKMWDQFKKLNPIEIIRNTNKSVAFFATEHFAGFIYIPFSVVENVIVARSLHLKPILNWINHDDQFYLITLSSKQCRLLKGDSFSLKEISHCSIEEFSKENINLSDKIVKQKFLAFSEDRFNKVVKEDSLPIVLGGVQELTEIYQKINRDRDLIDQRIIGNLDKSNFDTLHEECLLILNQRRALNAHNVISKYNELRPYGKVLDDLNQITIAAVQGRVRNLVIANDKFIWGKLDKVSGEIDSRINKRLAIPEDDVLDDLAEIVLARGGDVVLCKFNEMPSESEAFAFLR